MTTRHGDGQMGSCVLVRRVSGRVMASDCDPPIERTFEAVNVRDCQSEYPVLVFDPDRWQEFLDGVKAGEFDRDRERVPVARTRDRGCMWLDVCECGGPAQEGTAPCSLAATAFNRLP